VCTDHDYNTSVANGQALLNSVRNQRFGSPHNELLGRTKPEGTTGCQYQTCKEFLLVRHFPKA
jgi:hypothetical protein